VVIERSGESTVSRGEPHTPALTDLYLYLTGECNLRCSHCWISPSFSRADAPRSDSFVRREDLERTIRDAHGLGLQRVKLTGGEPLLYPELPGLLVFLAAENLQVGIETNGVLLDEERVGWLAGSSVANLSVSLDAAEPGLHDRIRGVRGSFYLALGGLQRLAAADLPFEIIMTLQRGNLDQVPGLVALCEERGAHTLKINPLQPCGRARAAFARGDNLAPDELLDLYRRLDSERPRASGLRVCLDLPVAMLSLEEILTVGHGECHIINILGLLSNGDYSICGIGEVIDELRLGNLRETPVAEVWREHSLLLELRRSLPGKLGGVCGHCIFKYRCLGSCRANAYALSRDLYAPYFLCQQYYEAGLFPPSRYY
jgi:SynChlorMet cassette radical SAM/SPASM protein ScmF